MDDRTRRTKKRILLISPSLPVNTGSGGAMRSYQILQELDSFADVDVVTCASKAIDPALAAAFRARNNYLGNIVMPTHSYLDPATITSGMRGRRGSERLLILPEKLGFIEADDKYAKKLRKIVDLARYDYIVVRYYESAEKLKLFDLDNVILDCDDCFLELAQQFLDVLRNKYINDLKKPKRVLFAKKSEQIDWEGHFSMFPNKVVPTPISSEECSSAESVVMLFVGVLNYPPNLFGLNHFLKNVWPQIFALRPNAILKIVGRGLPDAFKKAWSKIEGLRICGFVAEIDTVYKDVHFAILPMYQGSGTHIKVMDALIRGRTMVMSRLAHRGYEDTLLDGQSVFVVDSDSDFVDRIIYLIDNESARREMAAVGRECVLRHHAIGGTDCLLRTMLDTDHVPEIGVANFASSASESDPPLRTGPGKAFRGMPVPASSPKQRAISEAAADDQAVRESNAL